MYLHPQRVKKKTKNDVSKSESINHIQRFLCFDTIVKQKAKAKLEEFS